MEIEHEDSNWWYRSRRKVLSVFLDLIENKNEKSVLEIGCGSGSNLKYLFHGFKIKEGLEYNKDTVA